MAALEEPLRRSGTAKLHRFLDAASSGGAQKFEDPKPARPLAIGTTLSLLQTYLEDEVVQAEVSKVAGPAVMQRLQKALKECPPVDKLEKRGSRAELMLSNPTAVPNN